ncbi:MAG: L-threonylcarbamoyladenylate synthase [Patescibacteria group bacterium]|jgi:L-threonylcarbamoyladenylate synthase
MKDAVIIKKAVQSLRSGGVIGYPTDTTYGIGCVVSNLDAVDKVFELKGRDFSKPMSLAFSSVEMIKKYVKLPEEYEKILRKYLPGPYTFLLPKNDLVSEKITAGFGKVGVRIPKYDLIIKIIEELGEPIITTSANISGDPDIVRSDDLKLLVDFIVSGDCTIKIPSTLIDLETKSILRKGASLDTAKEIIAGI